MLEQAISRKPLQHPQTKSGAADSASGKCQAGNIIKRRSGRDFAPITAAAQFPNLTELDLCDSIEVGHRQLQWNPAQTGCQLGPEHHASRMQMWTQKSSRYFSPVCLGPGPVTSREVAFILSKD